MKEQITFTRNNLGGGKLVARDSFIAFSAAHNDCNHRCPLINHCSKFRAFNNVAKISNDIPEERLLRVEEEALCIRRDHLENTDYNMWSK
jgi:hypothetical protein